MPVFYLPKFVFFTSYQEEVLDEYTSKKILLDANLSSLEELEASNFLYTKKRARGSDLPWPLQKATRLGPGATSEDKAMALLRAALLTVEAALPQGSVDISRQGNWNSECASCWRSRVECSQGPGTLIECVILLEDTISSAFIRAGVSGLFSCMPRQWKAINDASVSNIAMRIWLLDIGIKYDSDSTGQQRLSTSRNSSKRAKRPKVISF